MRSAIPNSSYRVLSTRENLLMRLHRTKVTIRLGVGISSVTRSLPLSNGIHWGGPGKEREWQPTYWMTAIRVGDFSFGMAKWAMRNSLVSFRRARDFL